MNFGLEAKVGVFVIGCLMLIGAMSLRLVDYTFGSQDGMHVKAMLDDAAGLTKDATIIFSGVEVGIVEDIRLEHGKAVADLLVQAEHDLPANLKILVRSKGFLGEKYAELKLAGADRIGVLKEGDVLQESGEITDFDQLGNKIGDIADDVKAITASLRQVLATEEARSNMTVTLQNIREITDSVNKLVSDNQQRMNMIISNTEKLTETLSDLTVANAGNINEIVRNINSITRDLKAQTPLIAENLAVVTQALRQDGPDITKNIKNFSGDLDDVMSSQKENLKKSIENIATVTGKLEQTVDNLNNITGKINKGEGSIGRLVNDEDTVDNLNGALTGIKDTLGKLDQFRVDLAFSAESYGQTDNSKGHVDVKITPSQKRYYLIGLSTDQNGTSETKNTSVTRDYTKGTETDYTYYEEKTEQNPNAMLWTLQYAHRFWDDFFFRVGLYESDAGVGFDYHPLGGDLEDKLKFTADIYDFPDNDDDREVRTKIGAKYKFFKNLFVTAGYDDFLNSDTDSWFVGAGVEFRDDDLKYLLGKTPIPN
ncbi:MAG: MCE family protein [Denitrovibrio sp.]|nr:MAG: MCE family protein [Denitrovibrio sp.]